MKQINILSKKDRIPDFFLYPVRKNKNQLKNIGYDIKIYYHSYPKALSCDILGINSKFFSDEYSQPELIYKFLESAREFTNKIIWFDDTDSTADTHFELLPYLDLYLKKQLLKDRALYKNKYYGDRIFTDFYHRNFNVEDEKPIWSRPFDITQNKKVALSWHIGLGDMIGDILPNKINKIRRNFPPQYPNIFTSPQNSDRPLDIFFRGCRSYARNTVRFHREQIAELLEEMNYKSALKGWVSISKYKQEMKQAKLVVSPFGWGEIGVRDFECWIYGSCLIKPDMSHCLTWPDNFINNETYAPIDWNFENLHSTIEELIHNKEKRLFLANNGHQIYKQMVSKEGKISFCNWFSQQVEL